MPASSCDVVEPKRPTLLAHSSFTALSVRCIPSSLLHAAVITIKGQTWQEGRRTMQERGFDAHRMSAAVRLALDDPPRVPLLVSAVHVTGMGWINPRRKGRLARKCKARFPRPNRGKSQKFRNRHLAEPAVRREPGPPSRGSGGSVRRVGPERAPARRCTPEYPPSSSWWTPQQLSLWRLSSARRAALSSQRMRRLEQCCSKLDQLMQI